MSQTPTSGGTQILKRGMTPTHEQMVEWVLQNPGGTLREMGAYFGYSISWLSQVCNSDMFRAQVAERMKDIQAVVTTDIPQRMRALAELSIERMQEVLTVTSDADIIKDSFDKVMHRYGYAPNAKNGANSGNIQQQNNVFYLDKETFQQVKGRLIDAHAARLPQPEKEDGAESQRVSEEV